MAGGHPEKTLGCSVPHRSTPAPAVLSRHPTEFERLQESARFVSDFLGLGHMGQGMARNLIRAGHEVTVYNRSRYRDQQVRDHAGHC